MSQRRSPPSVAPSAENSMQQIPHGSHGSPIYAPLLSSSPGGSPESPVIVRRNAIDDANRIIDTTIDFLGEKSDNNGIDEHKELTKRIEKLKELQKRYTEQYNKHAEIIHTHRTAPGTKYVKLSDTEMREAEDENAKLQREIISTIDDIEVLKQEIIQLDENVRKINRDIYDKIMKLRMVKAFISNTNPPAPPSQRKTGCCPCFSGGSKTKKLRFFKLKTKNVYSKYKLRKS